MAIPATTASAAPGPDARARPGDRFWLLADSDDENDHDGTVAGGKPTGIASPTPSCYICEAFQVGYLEEEVAGVVDVVVPHDDPARLGLVADDKIDMARWIVHHRTVVRPWHGPLPKVQLPKLTLSDFLTPSWQVL
ncbi:Myosin-4 [Hordeum vulgare]|nr:Myosin-4 [Hordeum vulgare]